MAGSLVQAKISFVTVSAASATAGKQSAPNLVPATKTSPCVPQACRIQPEKIGVAMNISRKKRILVISAYLLPAMCGLVRFATPVGPQSAVSLPAGGSDSVACTRVHGAAALT